MATISEALTIAIRHHQAGHLQAAEEIYRHIVAVDPDNAQAWQLLGVVAHQVGRHEVAVAHIRRAIGLKADEPMFYSNLGEAYRGCKKVPEAIASYQQALALRPDLAEVHYNLGNALKDAGRPADAIASYRRAVELRPDHAQAWNNFGSTLLAEKRPGEALENFQRALHLRPDFVEAHNNLGLALGSLGRHAEATAAFHSALALNPRHVAAHTNLGNLCCELGQLPEATTWYRRAVELNPDFAEAHYNLGFALQRQGQLSESEACFARAVALRPNYSEAYNNFGVILKDQGRLDEAIERYRQALQYEPRHTAAHSNLLLTLQYRNGVTLEELATAHEEYQQRHAAPLRSQWRDHPQDRTPDRPLRLGFLSPDFRCHPVAYFLIRVLEHLDPAGYAKFCYYDRRTQDRLTARFAAAATTWRNVTEQTDEQIAEQIRADQIDILFDLTGHTAFNRLLVFARRPAPIQITWIGYEGTTGLEAIDYILADRYTIPEGTEHFYREKVLRMPAGYVCYDPPADAPPVGPLPAARTGSIQFASFNNLAKITRQTVEAWSAVLQRVPGSRLTLQYHGLGDEGVRRRYLEMFAAAGVAADRLNLSPPTDYAAYLASYNDVDVALDPFPFGGGITTCDALWMGVPVISLPGETVASRHSMSHLCNVGMTETVARDRDQYIELAVGLASDLPRLAAIRAGLRERMAASRLCDGPQFATDLTRLLREVWHAWCDTPK
jgi:predicted O-linked N-acetylglucosamine transferase (SPINDLY family)